MQAQIQASKGRVAKHGSSLQILADSLQQELLIATTQAPALRQELSSAADKSLSTNQVLNVLKLCFVSDVGLFLSSACAQKPVALTLCTCRLWLFAVAPSCL